MPFKTSFTFETVTNLSKITWIQAYQHYLLYYTHISTINKHNINIEDIFYILKQQPVRNNNTATVSPFLKHPPRNISPPQFPNRGLNWCARKKNYDAARSDRIQGSPRGGFREPNANFYKPIIWSGPWDAKPRSFCRTDGKLSQRLGIKVDCVCACAHAIRVLNAHLCSCFIRGTLHHRDWCQLGLQE